MKTVDFINSTEIYNNLAQAENATREEVESIIEKARLAKRINSSRSCSTFRNN